ncbi:MAG TPA: hypothetical protein PKD70_12810 [Saprospiraceae bacterium]|nr:hypothetical protein [Saprospiraceae bacterium]
MISLNSLAFSIRRDTDFREFVRIYLLAERDIFTRMSNMDSLEIEYYTNITQEWFENSIPTNELTIASELTGWTTQQLMALDSQLIVARINLYNRYPVLFDEQSATRTQLLELLSIELGNVSFRQNCCGLSCQESETCAFEACSEERSCRSDAFAISTGIFTGGATLGGMIGGGAGLFFGGHVGLAVGAGIGSLVGGSAGLIGGAIYWGAGSSRCTIEKMMRCRRCACY